MPHSFLLPVVRGVVAGAILLHTVSYTTTHAWCIQTSMDNRIRSAKSHSSIGSLQVQITKEMNRSTLNPEKNTYSGAERKGRAITLCRGSPHSAGLCGTNTLRTIYEAIVLRCPPLLTSGAVDGDPCLRHHQIRMGASRELPAGFGLQ
ncbi:hypothetical protein OH77DRAFT_899152 [Trametes cingulata]|nr:hypothetical protein OH77DRAFT_899152 [Trametes cingulata]